MVYWIAFFFFSLLFFAPMGAAAIRWLRGHDSQERRLAANAFAASYQWMRRPFFYLSGIYILALSALFRANFAYLDDMTRLLTGMRGWKGWGRYLSTILSPFIHADEYLTDNSPMQQVLAVAALVLSSLVLIYLISGKKKASLWSLIASVPLGLSPYFLPCFTYKFDTFYMAVSILASILPLLMWGRGILLYTSAVALGNFMMCNSYQASSGIFPMAVLLLCLLRWNRGESNRELGRFLLSSVAGYLVALLAFKFFVMKTGHTYIDNSVPGIAQLIPNTISNLLTYYRSLVTELRVEWLALAGLIGVAFVYIVVRDTRRRRLPALLAAVATLLLMALLTFGMYPVLQEPLFELRAMYGFGALLALLGITVAVGRRVYLGKLACLALSWIFIVFSLTYGNALHVQDEYARFRADAVVQDLNHLEAFATDDEKTLQVSGNIGYSPVLENMPQDYALLRRLVPTGFSSGPGFGSMRLCFYGLKNVTEEESVDLTERDLPVLLDASYHTIRGDGRYFLVELK